MKKLLAALCALIICLACAPALSGCSAAAQFVLKEDGQGNKYYAVNCSGFVSSFKGEYVIPETYGEGENEAPVTEIVSEGFAGTGLTKITIPKTVTKIGAAAFAYCYGLREVVFDEGSEIDEISRGAFGYDEALEKINIPATVKTIGDMAFMNCSALFHISLPDGLETIGEQAFYFSGLREIIIPDSVHDIVLPDLDENGEQKKDEDGKLLTVTIPAVGIAAFHSCVSITYAVVGQGVTTIKSGVFGSCIALERVYLPATLERVEGACFVAEKFYSGHAFHNDTALTDVYFAGTEEQWNALKENIDEKPVVQSGATYDNTALIDAARHYGTSYTENN